MVFASPRLLVSIDYAPNGDNCLQNGVGGFSDWNEPVRAECGDEALTVLEGVGPTHRDEAAMKGHRHSRGTGQIQDR